MSVFISYNHNGDEDIAFKILDNLSCLYNINANLSAETNTFDISVTDDIDDCSDYIIVITENVLKECGNAEDAVINEAKFALLKKKNIIPVLYGIKHIPDKLPQPLSEIFAYKSVAWTNEIQSCKRIQSLLVSKKRISLYFKGKDANYLYLSDETENALKELYKSFVKYGRESVDIEIQTDLQNAWIERKLQRQLPILKTALDIMFADKKLDLISSSFLQEKYIEDNGEENCTFIDDNGILQFMYTPYLWEDIITDIFKYIFSDRANNKENYYPIDCIFKDKKDETVCEFRSWLPKESDNKKYLDLVGNFKPGNMYFIHGYEISWAISAIEIYPDFYYRLGLLKYDNEQLFNSLKETEGAFDFDNYIIGLA